MLQIIGPPQILSPHYIHHGQLLQMLSLLLQEALLSISSLSPYRSYPGLPRITQIYFGLLHTYFGLRRATSRTFTEVYRATYILVDASENCLTLKCKFILPFIHLHLLIYITLLVILLYQVCTPRKTTKHLETLCSAQNVKLHIAAHNLLMRKLQIHR